MKGILSLSADQRPQGAGVLKIHGSVDASTIKPFEAAFLRFQEAGIRTIVLDMALMEYINSAGLSLIIKAKTECAKQKGDVILVRPQTPILNILKMMGLTDLFRVASSVEEALYPPD